MARPYDKKRVRVDLHKAWKNRNDLPYIKTRLSKMKPEELIQLLSRNNLPEYADNYTDNITETYANDYDSRPDVCSAFKNGKMMSIEEYCETYGLDFETVSSFKLITHTGVPFYNIVFKSTESSIQPEDVIDVVRELSKGLNMLEPVQYVIDRSGVDHKSCRLIITDCHIGMDVCEEGATQYGGIWNREEFLDRIDKAISWAIENGKGCGTIYVDELGDYLDGLDGFTTRGGHKLPQNMTDLEAFKVGVEGKARLMRGLSPYFNRVVFNCVDDDNHAGKFASFVNHAAYLLSDAFENVEFNQLGKFMNHYFVGEHCFILCHGKDSKYMKYGMKVFPDLKSIEKVDTYCKQNRIYRKAKFITFCKGDSHQKVFDYTSSSDFDYMSYPAFSPSSGYIQANFKPGESGFCFEVIHHDRKDIFRMDMAFVD